LIIAFGDYFWPVSWLLPSCLSAPEKWHNRLYKRGAIFAFLCWVPGVGDIFAVGLGLLRANIWITAISMLAGKFLRYVIWGWMTGLVF
jgi:membrane protein YqaA with SNARE-associated domain